MKKLSAKINALYGLLFADTYLLVTKNTRNTSYIANTDDKTFIEWVDALKQEAENNMDCNDAVKNVKEIINQS